jgi:hypothetical protein
MDFCSFKMNFLIMKTIPVQHPLLPSVLVSSARLARRQALVSGLAGQWAFPGRGPFQKTKKKTFFVILRHPFKGPVSIKGPKRAVLQVFSENGVNFEKRKP